MMTPGGYSNAGTSQPGGNGNGMAQPGQGGIWNLQMNGAPGQEAMGPQGYGGNAQSPYGSGNGMSMGGGQPQQGGGQGGGYSPNGNNPLSPTLFQGAQLGSPQSLGALGQFLSPQNTIQQIMAGFAPQAQNSTNALNQQLAAMGMSGGQNVAAQSQLQQQLASGLAPSLAQAIQGSQSNILGALGENAGFQQQSGLANQGALNNAGTNYANMLQNAYNNQTQGWENLNSAGLSGLQGLAGQALGNAGGLAQGQQGNYGIQTGGGNAWGGLGSAIGGMFNTQPSNPFGNSVPGGIW